MDRARSRYGGPANVFKGSQLVTSVLERYPGHLANRKAALQFCRQLFKEGTIRGVFDVDSFEDSVLLYTWNEKHEQTANKPTHKMTSQSYIKSRGGYGYSSADTRVTKRDLYNQGDVAKQEVEQTQQKPFQSYTHLPTDSYFVGNVHVQNTPEPDSIPRKPSSHYRSSPNYKRASTASSESSVEIASRSYLRTRDKNHHSKPPLGYSTAMTLPHDHDVIPEEVTEEHHVPLMERTGTSTEYDGTSSIPRSGTTDVSHFNDIDSSAHQRPWTDYQNSYSDNEKQLIEQMKRMKKEHSHILRTYEDRINKLMNKMHELRNIAQMLENSSTKSSPYGMLPSKPAGYGTPGSRPDQPDRKPGMFYGSDGEPPPLPPRPGRGSRVNPNKPLVTPGTKMKPLDWTRIILRDKRTEDPSTIWHMMQEPAVDSEEVERLFSNPDVLDTDGATLYDDLIIRRGRSRQQLVSIYDSERSKRIVICMKCLRATLTDVISTVSSLDTSQINHEGLAELFEFLGSAAHIEKTLHYVRRKGAGQLDHPEYLIFELSKVDHFKDRLEFIRFRYKTQWHLFEIEQQLRELNTACNELTNSMSLKNLLETLLAVGNYLNGNTDFGQADGFALDILTRLKDTHERDGKGTLLEFVLKTYCQVYESEVDIGCPTRFRLPEPSNMRHAAQVSFEGIQDALSNLLSDLRSVREKLLDQKARKDAIRPTDSFRVTAENFFAAALEVIGAQDKVLQDVRDLFLRTVRYFQIESAAVSPQQFFQIFAVFLHDCKYFWKLAHRRLAKERFELEFKFKGQLSAVDLHGYGSFRAGVIEGIHSSRPTDPKTSTLTRDEKTNKTRNENMPIVPPKPSHMDMRKNIQHADHLDHSPKPLTSNPPSSETLYKPLPKTPQTPTNQNGVHATLLSPNYENQAELNMFYPKHNTNNNVNQNKYGSGKNDGRMPDAKVDARDSSKDKKNQQHSLKMWLKKEREQVKREIDSDNNNENHTSNKKSNTSTRSFTRLKNSMIQRFSGGNSNKKDVNSKEQNKEQKPTKSQYPEPVVEAYESEVAPNQFHSPRGYHQPPAATQYNSSRNRYLQGPDYDYNLSNTDVVISPIDDPDQDDIPSPVVPAFQTNTTTSETFTDRQQRFGETGHRTESYRVESDKVLSVSVQAYNTPIKMTHVTPNVHRYEGLAIPNAKPTNNYENQPAFQTPNNAAIERGDNNSNVGEGPTNQIPPSERNGILNSVRSFQSGGQSYHDKYDKRNVSKKAGTSIAIDNGTPKSSYAPTNTPRVDNEHFLTPGTREPMHIKSIGSLSEKFNAINNNTENEALPKPMDVIQETNDNMLEASGVTQQTPKITFNGDVSDMSPPLPPRTYTSNEALKSSRSDLQPRSESQDRTSYMSAYDRLQNLTIATTASQFSTPQSHVSQFSTPQPFSRQTRSDSNIRSTGRHEQTSGIRHVNYPAPYLNTGSQSYQQNGLGDNGARFGDQDHSVVVNGNNNQNETDERDEGYRAQLRRAANINPSAFTGYGSLKPNMPYTGRASLGPGYPSPSSTAVVKPTVMTSHEVSYMAF